MPNYSKDNLKNLVTYLDSLTESLQEQNKGEIVYDFETLTKYLKATYFDPMLFETWPEMEGTFADVLLYEKDDLPLLVRGDSEQTEILVRWRLTEGV